MLKDGLSRIKIRRHKYYGPVSLQGTFSTYEYKWDVWWDDGGTMFLPSRFNTWREAMDFADSVEE